MTSASASVKKVSKKSTATKGGKPKKTITKKASTKKDTSKAATTKSHDKKLSKVVKGLNKSRATTPKKSRASTPKKTKATTPKKSKATTPKKSRTTTPKKRSKKEKKPKVQLDDTAVIITGVEDDLQKLLRDNVSKELLIELLECNNVKIAKSSKKDVVVKSILDQSLKKGVSVVRDSISKETASLVVAELKGSEPNAPNNKGELQKELKEQLNAAGSFTDALKKLKVSTVDKVSEELGFTEDGTADEKVEGLVEETTLLGVRRLFDRTSYNFVKEVAQKADLSIKGQKEHLIARFLGQAHRPWLDDAKVPEKEKREKGEKKEKAPGPDPKLIKAGISDLELHQYFVKDLENYITENALRKGHNKKENVKIISAFLKGDQSVLAVNSKKAGGKRKRETEENESNKKQKTA